jgi:DNA-directed RNA polymerase specialized sigma24 family protein
MDKPWGWYFLVLGWEAEGEGFEYPDVMRPTSELLEQDWGRAKKYLREWIEANAEDVGDLFRYPKSYPDAVVFIGLCALHFSPQQAEIIEKFLSDSVFKGVAWEGSKEFREHLGYLDKPDQSFKTSGLRESPREIDRDLYEHFVGVVLKDVYKVTTNVLGWLRTAARNHLHDLHDKTQAASRPALQLPGLQEDEAGESPTEDEELSAIVFDDPRQRRARRRRQLALQEDETDSSLGERREPTEHAPDDPGGRNTRRKHLAQQGPDYRISETAPAVTEEVELADLLERSRLSPRERELATLLAQGYKPAECASKMGVSRPMVSKLLHQLAHKLDPGRQDFTLEA